MSESVIDDWIKKKKKEKKRKETSDKQILLWND